MWKWWCEYAWDKCNENSIEKFYEIKAKYKKVIRLLDLKAYLYEKYGFLNKQRVLGFKFSSWN